MVFVVVFVFKQGRRHLECGYMTYWGSFPLEGGRGRISLHRLTPNILSELREPSPSKMVSANTSSLAFLEVLNEGRVAADGSLPP